MTMDESTQNPQTETAAGGGAEGGRHPKIKVRNLTKIFGPKEEAALEQVERGRTKEEIHEVTGHVVGVRDVSFDVYEGEVFVVMGLSGSGKSTLVRMLNRLIEPTRGEVLVEDADILQMGRKALIQLRRRDIAMVFQHFALMPHLTNFDNAAFGLDIAGVKDPERSERVNRALKTVGLSAFAESHPYELSGGMQQRVGLARALSLDPTIMLLDEAFSALDPLIRTEMQDELLKIQRERGITVVFISHDLREALRVGDRLAIMDAGEVIQIGTPRDLIMNPANDYVRSFLEDIDKRQVLVAQDLMADPPALLDATGEAGLQGALETLETNGGFYLYLRESDGRFLGVASRDTLRAAIADGKTAFDAALLDDVESVRPDQRFYDMIGPAAAAPCPLPVTDEAGRLTGVVPQSAMLETLGDNGGGR